MDILAGLPDDWKHDIDLVRNPGRDDKGDIVAGFSERVAGCLLAINEVSELDNLNSSQNVKGRVFIPRNVQVASTDRIVTYSPAPVAGRWAVKGPAMYWPFGTEVRVEWEGGNV